MHKQKVLSICLVGLIVIVGSLTFADTPVNASGCDTDFVLQEGNIITVLPTGIDDTDNLQCAFDQAVTTGPGSTVKLDEATYYISSSIDVVNFDGAFDGAGKDRTIIQNLDDVPFPLIAEPFPHPAPVFQYPVLFRFYQDENGSPVTIDFSDMTIQAIGESSPWSYHGLGPFQVFVIVEIVGKVTGVEDFEVSTVNTSFDNMSFKGEAGDFSFRGVNVVESIYIHGEAFNEYINGLWYLKYHKPLKGNHTITDCTFRNAHAAIDPWNISDSDFRVEKNHFEYVDYATFIYDFSNSTVNISSNEIRSPRFTGIFAAQAVLPILGDDLGPYGELPAPSSILISHNNIENVFEEADGIGVYDFSFVVGSEGLLDVVISHNNIALNDTFYGGISGFGVQDSIISNNRISGIGPVGIYLGISGDPVRDCTLLGNNLQNLDAYIAPIWLGPGTENCKVVGGSNKTNVWDEGIDNLLIGVNNMPGNSPSLQMQEAMQLKMEFFNTIR